MFSLVKDLMRDVCEEIEMAVELEHFQIKVEVTPDIEVLITAHDPLDCVVIAGWTIEKLKEMGYEPYVLILP